MFGPNLTTVELRESATWARLEAHLPGHRVISIGILLLDTAKDRVHIKLKSEWWEELVHNEESQVWQLLSEDLNQKARDMGATNFVSWIGDCCSHSFQMSPIQAVAMADPGTCLNALYREQVDPIEGNVAASKLSLAKLLNRMFTRPFQSLIKNWFYRASSTDRWNLQGALAASLLVAAAIAGRQSFPTRHEEIISVSKAVELPLVSEFHLQHVQLNLPSNWQRARHYFPRRKTHVSARVVRPFVIAPRFATPHSVQIAVAHPPSLPVHDVALAGPIPPHFLSQPELPPYHPRHNRFVRALAVMTVPFRFIASK